MKVRGSLKVTKDLVLEGPGGSIPKEGLVALSDSSGSLRWGHFAIPSLDLSFTYPDKGAVVSYEGGIYYSVVKKASGISILNTALWKKLGVDYNGNNNIVKTITVLVSDVDGIGTIKEQLCRYILGLPSQYRTISLLESKWNILFEGSVYEIVNKGVGEITEIAAENLISIGSEKIEKDFLNIVLEGDVTGSITYEGGVPVIRTVAKSRPDLNDKYFEYIQHIPSSLWVITHNMNKKPSVTVTDSAGTVVQGAIKHSSNNQLTVAFNGAFSGSASLN